MGRETVAKPKLHYKTEAKIFLGDIPFCNSLSQKGHLNECVCKNVQSPQTTPLENDRIKTLPVS